MPLFNTSKSRTIFLLSVLTAVSLAFVPAAWQQTDVINRIISKLTTLYNKYPQEKVFLHLDKPYYAAGEDIWFKAYLVNAYDHAPSALSKVLYVELITPENTFYKTSVIRLDKGRGKGDFALPDDIPEGMYRLRAYTSWMQNFDEAYVFHQNITIWNPRKNDVVSTTNFTFKRQGSGDSVLVHLSLQNHQKKPYTQTSVSYSTNYDKKATTRKVVTNAEGKAVLRLYLPNNDVTSPKLHFTVEQQGNNIHKTVAFPTSKEDLDIQFFPEGGNLVSSLWNTVGFKALDANGVGKDIQGAIYDQNGQKVVDFKSQKFGMGRLGFIPDASKRYVARLTSPKTSKEYPLPLPQKKGFILSVDAKPDATLKVKFYTLGFNTDSIGKPKSLYLVGQVRGEVLYAASSPTGLSLFQVDVPMNKFPTGIAQFTVFSEKGEPLAERLVFINHGPQVQLSLTQDKPTYKAREKVTLQVQAKDQTGAPIAGNFSLAITDQKAVTPTPHAASIVSYLLLSSDLKGYIEEPSYYFSANTPEVKTALDNLMLTQGWRRFIWKDIMLDKYPQINFQPEKDLAITGTVTKISGQPDAYASVTLMNLNNLNSMITGQANERGKFKFDLYGFSDSSKLVVQASKGIAASMLVLDNNLPQLQVYPQVPYFPLPAPLSNDVWVYLQRNREQLKLDQFSGKSGILLQQVVVRGRKEEERVISSGSLLTTPDRIIKSSELVRGIDILQSLQGRVAGLQVSNGQVIMRGGGPALILLDGMPVDGQFLQSLTANEVESIEILKPGPSAAIYGSQGGNGVVAVISKKGGDTGSTPSNSFTKLPGSAPYQGLYYQKAREFYMPRYDKPDTSNVVMPDFRTTLYWNPNIQTDASGKAEVTFYTSDQNTTFRAVLQGMTPTGQLGHVTSTFQVK